MTADGRTVVVVGIARPWLKPEGEVRQCCLFLRPCSDPLLASQPAEEVTTCCANCHIYSGLFGMKWGRSSE